MDSRDCKNNLAFLLYKKEPKPQRGGSTPQGVREHRRQSREAQGNPSAGAFKWRLTMDSRDCKNNLAFFVAKN
jgi:hypothetical protein